MEPNHNILELVIRWTWVPIAMIIARVWVKITGLETRSALLEQAQSHFKTLRDKDEKHQQEERDHVLHKIDEHHRDVMRRFDKVESALAGKADKV